MIKIQEIAEFNQKQFDNIHKTVQKYDSNLAYNQDKLHNIVGVLRANTYIHKDWIKKTKQCSFFDYIARLIQLDFICTPFPNMVGNDQRGSVDSNDYINGLCRHKDCITLFKVPQWEETDPLKGIWTY